MNKKFLIIFLIIFFGVLFFAKISQAATYYVSTSGNDSNSGTSESSPWKTISKVNSSTFQPGDNILFKRGETWREALAVPSNGSAGNPITFGAYGSREKPIINGADLVTTWVAGSAQDEAGDRMWDNFEYTTITDKWPNAVVTAGNSAAIDSVFYQGAKSFKSSFASAGGNDNAYINMYNLGDVLTTYGNGQQQAQSDFYVTFRFRYDITNPWLTASSYYMNKILLLRPFGYGAMEWLNANPITLNLNPDGSLFYSVNGSSQVDTTYNIPASTWVQVKVRLQMPNAGTNQSTITIWVDGGQKATANFTGWHNSLNLISIGGCNMRTQVGNAFSFNYDNVSVGTYNPGTVTPYSASVGWDSPYSTEAYGYAMSIAVDGVSMDSVYSMGGLRRNSFYFNDVTNTAYLVLASGDNPDLHTVEVGRRQYCISAGGNGKNYITIDSLDLRNAAQTIVYPNQGTYWTITNSTLFNAPHRGILLDDPGSNIDHHLTVQNCTISYIGWGNIMGITGGIIGDRSSYVLVEDSIFHHIGEHALRASNSGGNYIVRRSTFHDLGSSSFAPKAATTNLFENNEVYNASLYDIKAGVTGGGGIVRYNKIHDCWGHGGVGIWDSNVQIYYNLFYNNHGFDISDVAATTGVTIYNNVFYSLIGDENGTAAYSIGSSFSDSTGWIIQNNIGRYLRFGAGVPTVSYNNWYRPGTVDVVDVNGTKYGATTPFATWVAIPHAGELSTDPLFANASGADFYLTSNSPAINTGTNVGLTRDFDGITVPQSSAPDIGAYEYVGAVPPDTTPPAPPSGVSVQ